MAKTTIHSDYIPDNAITSTKIAENSIGAREIATNAITTLYVADGSVTTVKIADTAITTAKITDDAVTSAKLDTNIDIAGTFDVTGATTLDAGLTVDTTTLVVDASNNRVGVGTASPGQAFHVSGSSATFIQVGNSNGDVLYGVNTAGNAFVSGQTASKTLLLETNNSPRLMIDGNGAVGIGTGTSSIAAGQMQIVGASASTNGMVRLQNNMDNNYETLRIESLGDYDAHIGFFADGASNDYFWGMGVDYSDSGKFKISQDNLLATNTRVTITTDGKVGIGTTTPSQALHVNGQAQLENNLVLNEATHAIVTSSGDLRLFTGGGEKARLTSGGALGIGTGASPGANRLSVRNSTYSSSNRMLIVSNGNEDTGTAYDTVVINQYDVPTLRLIETQNDVQMSISCGNENSNSAVLGTTGKLVFTTGNSADYSGYSVANKRFEITDSNNYSWNALFVRSTDDQILSLDQNDTGGWNYIGFLSQNTRKWYVGMNNTSNFTIGSDVAGQTVDISNANLRAPGMIVQTQVARVDNVVGTGDFDLISVNITPKFSDSDMLIHFYTQWSVAATFDGEDWGLALYRDNSASTGLGDGQNNYFISGGGVDASDNPLAQTNYSQPKYYVRFASKTDIDTGRSSGTSQITYKIRKLVPAGTSTKTVRFGVDGWTGSGDESQRSKIVLMVQEIQPN